MRNSLNYLNNDKVIFENHLIMEVVTDIYCAYCCLEGRRK